MLCCWTDAFFAPTAFTGQQLAGVSAPSHTSGVTIKIFDWKRRQEPDGVGKRWEMQQDGRCSSSGSMSSNSSRIAAVVQQIYPDL